MVTTRITRSCYVKNMDELNGRGRNISSVGGWNTSVTSTLAFTFCDIAVISTHRTDSNGNCCVLSSQYTVPVYTPDRVDSLSAEYKDIIKGSGQ